MFKIITILGLLLVSPNTLSATNIQLDMASLVDDLMSGSDAMKKRINRSGKQRMLTQRMTKLALLISLNIDKDKNQKSLLKFANLYNDTLAEFKAGKTDLGFTKEANLKIDKQRFISGSLRGFKVDFVHFEQGEISFIIFWCPHLTFNSITSAQIQATNL